MTIATGYRDAIHDLLVTELGLIPEGGETPGNPQNLFKSVPPPGVSPQACVWLLLRDTDADLSTVRADGAGYDETVSCEIVCDVESHDATAPEAQDQAELLADQVVAAIRAHIADRQQLISGPGIRARATRIAGRRRTPAAYAENHGAVATTTVIVSTTYRSRP